jgi:hypothetical protein
MLSFCCNLKKNTLLPPSSPSFPHRSILKKNNQSLSKSKKKARVQALIDQPGRPGTVAGVTEFRSSRRRRRHPLWPKFRSQSSRQYSQIPSKNQTPSTTPPPANSARRAPLTNQMTSMTPPPAETMPSPSTTPPPADSARRAPLTPPPEACPC